MNFFHKPRNYFVTSFSAFTAFLLSYGLPAIALAQIPGGGGGGGAGGGGGGGIGDYGAYSSGGFAGGIFVEAICDLMGLVTGELGALFGAVALLAALVVAVTNNFRGFAAAIFVVVGCYTVASWLSFGFGQFSCQ